MQGIPLKGYFLSLQCLKLLRVFKKSEITTVFSQYSERKSEVEISGRLTHH